MNNIDEMRYNLIRKFLIEAKLWNDRVETYLRESKFETQDDGGMGSFGIRHVHNRIGIRDYADAQYIDADGTKVVIALIGDGDGYPTDMDFWKVDSSPLIRFPDANRLHVNVKK